MWKDFSEHTPNPSYDNEILIINIRKEFIWYAFVEYGEGGVRIFRREHVDSHRVTQWNFRFDYDPLMLKYDGWRWMYLRDVVPDYKLLRDLL